MPRKTNQQLTLQTLPTDEDFEKFNKMIRSESAVEKFGYVTKIWAFKNIFKCCEYVETEFEHHEKGTHRVQWFLSMEQGWRMGYPPFAPKDKLCLYNEDMLSDEIDNILLVEGLDGLNPTPENIGDISRHFVTSAGNTYLIMSYGEHSQADRRRWMSLTERKSTNIVIWPRLYRDVNRDGSEKQKTAQPGFKTALDIKEKILPWAKILDVYEWDSNNELPEGFGLGACLADGYSIEKFLQVCPYFDAKKDREKRLAHSIGFAPFKFLGYDQKNFYFLTGRSSSFFNLPRKGIANTALFNLAPLDWWIDHFPGGRSVDWNSAIDWLINESISRGYVANNKFRRAGFWKDGSNFYCNNGREIITNKGEKIPYSKIESEYCYIQSSITIDKITGDQATDKQGEDLVRLFEAQNFKTRLQAWEACGWAIMAPFYSMLTRRPLMWIKGASMSGKSWLIENVMAPLACELAFSGTPKTTDSQFKHQLGTDNRVAYFDEMETRSKNNRQNMEAIESKIQMARDSTSNSSNKISHTGKDGEPVTFEINSGICFSSVIPYLDSAPLESRFICPELSAVLDEKTRKEKQSGVFKILQTGLMDDPKIFMRRLFANIDQIIKNIEWLKKEIASILEDQRKADNYAPIFAGIFALTNTGEITPEFFSLIGEMLADIKERTIETDEEALINIILESNVEADGGKRKLISELVHEVLNNEDAYASNMALGRCGLTYDQQTDSLAIATNNGFLRGIFAGSPYGVKYGEVLIRHPGVDRRSGVTQNVFFAGSRKKCVVFRRQMFLKILDGGGV
jgi:hypothetical protein